MHLVINLDKPKGLTSQEAVTKVKRIFRAKKAGHAGTLDPIATGVLLVCLGEATKITSFLSDLEKEYVATLKLGERTDTLDAEGKIIEKVEGFTIRESAIEDVLSRFKGEIRQTPPMYSALKVSGRPLYELARRGIVLERAPRTVLIKELETIGYEPPLLKLRVVCSKGTYIRSLADDIGLALGVGAHVAELRRTRIGIFSSDNSAAMEELPHKQSALHPVDSALRHLRDVVLSESEYSLASHGNPLALRGDFGEGERLRLKDPSGALFALGIAAGERIKIERLLHLR
jgi:tRNA pseudouridine55 synthase